MFYWGKDSRGASPTCRPGSIHHLGPLLLGGGDLDVITVGALVTIPQQQPGQEVKEQ